MRHGLYSSDVQANTPSYRSYQFKHCMTLIYFFLLFQHLTLIKAKKKCRLFIFYHPVRSFIMKINKRQEKKWRTSYIFFINWAWISISQVQKSSSISLSHAKMTRASVDLAFQRLQFYMVQNYCLVSECFSHLNHKCFLWWSIRDIYEGGDIAEKK